MSTYTIEKQQNGDRGRYVIILPDGDEAEMTFVRNADVMRITHTGVPERYEGQGLGRALLDRAIADARAENFKIVPACSYVMVQFKRHAEEWADVIAD